MRKFRIFFALLLTAALAAASALAAPDTNAVPSFTMNAPASAVAGTSAALQVTPTLPGFLTIRLLDASGREVAVLCRNHELHTLENGVSVPLRDAEGGAIPAGTYQLSAVMESQFGVASQTVSASIAIQAAPNLDAPAEEEDEEDEDAAEAEAEEDGEQKAATLPAATARPAAVPASSYAGVDYASSGSLSVGSEGLQIGVGVSDTAEQDDAGYWGLTASSSDEEIWAALTRDMIAVDVDERESAYIYDSTGEGRARLGTVSGLSQGLNVISDKNGWALVEAFRNEDGAFVRGYIRSNRLRVVEPNKTYGIVIDKQAQTLTVFKDGKPVGSCDVSTGQPTEQYLHRETPAGEFITVTRRGTTEYPNGRGYCQYTIRFNGNYYLCEIPATKRGGSDFSMLEDSLGIKASRGNVLIAHAASTDGGINAEWIWNMTDSNKKVKVLIFDDKDRSDVPVGE